MGDIEWIIVLKVIGGLRFVIHKLAGQEVYLSYQQL